MMKRDDVCRAWLTEAVGEIPAAGARRVGHGLWGPTVELGDGTLLKLVRGSAGIGHGLDLCANEARVLQTLDGKVESPALPRLLAHGAFSPVTQAACAGYAAWLRMTRVPGTAFDEAALAELSPSARDEFAYSFGHSLALLQSTARQAAGGQLTMLDERIRTLLMALPAASQRAADRDLAAALLAAVDNLPAERRGGFVHGDAHLANLTVDAAGKVCGFFDLAEGGRGFPEIDLVYLHWLPEIAESAQRGYEAVAGPIDMGAFQLAGAVYALTGAVIAERRGETDAAAADRALLRSCLAAIGVGG